MSICLQNCVQEFISSLEERQDIGKILKSEPDVATTKILKADLHSVDFEDLSLFVVHQLLRLYTYSDTTLVGYGSPARPHVVRHELVDKQAEIRSGFKAAMKLGLGSCDCHADPETFDVLYLSLREIPAQLKSLQGTLLFNVFEDEEYLTVELVYGGNQAITKGQLTLGQLATTAKLIIDQVCANPEMKQEDLVFVPRETITSFGSIAADEMLSTQTMATLFESAVARHPTKLALVAGLNKFSYAEVNSRSEQLAQVIQASWVESSTGEPIVALCLDRSELLIFAILAVWKSGGAYVPIDPNYPAGRKDLIVKDCKPNLLLTDAQSLDNLPWVDCPVVNVSAIDPAWINPRSTQVRSKTNDLAFIVYTSGTTGQPKGVMITQSSLVNQCQDYRNRYDALTEDEVVVQLFNYAFNAFQEPLTLTISAGLTLVMVSFKLLMEPKAILDYMVANHVTHIDGTPSLATQFNFTKLKTLKRVAVGGEPLTESHRSIFLKNNPSIRIYNIYGNSEGTLCTLTADVTTTASFEFTRAVVNKKVSLLSSCLKPLPRGAVGELCLEGAGIARGYLNNDTLTQQKFVQNRTGMRLYRTGDLCVQTPSGGILFLGRKDMQVKVRGIRVEVGEIESELMKIAGISKSAVIWQEGTEGHQLIGFYSSTNDNLEVRLVRQSLSRVLPEYMVPSKLFCLETFPLTPNGKVDRAGLHKLVPTEVIQPSSEQKMVSAFDELAIRRVWEDVLCLPAGSVETTSNFFSLGGNSLLAIKVLNVIYDTFGVSLNASRIMESGGSFESFLNLEPNLNDPPQASSLVRRTTNDNLPLSTAQERILAGNSNFTNHILLEFDPTDFDLGVKQVLTHLQNLVRRHEILRTTYPVTRFGTRIQNILKNPNVPTTQIAESDMATFEEKFDLEKDLPIKVGIVDKTKILIVVHAVAIDFQGLQIFLEELTNENVLVEKTQLGYADYALFQTNHVVGSEVKESVSFWKDAFNLPPAPHGPRGSGQLQIAETRLDPLLFRCLRQVAETLDISLYDLFLTAQVVTQASLESEDEVTVGTYLSIRDHPQLFGLIGNLTHVAPLTFHLDDTLDLVKVIQLVTQGVKRAKVHQSFPLDMATVAASGVGRLVKSELFRFMFDFRVNFSTASKKFGLDGIKGKILEVKGASTIMPSTHMLTVVDLSDSEVRLEFRGNGNVSKMKTEFIESLTKLSQIMAHG